MSTTALKNGFRHVATVPMSAPARLVLLALCNRHNQETGRCDPSVTTIAADVQLSERSVRNGLRELEELKLISTTERKRRTGRGKRNMTNRYRIKGGARFAGGVGHSLPTNLEDNARAKADRKSSPSAFDDLVMSIEVDDA